MSDIVEKLFNDGIIKESQIQEMEEFRNFVKEAGWLSSVSQTIKPFAKDFGRSLLAALPAAAIVAGGSRLADKLDDKRRDDNLNSSLKTLMRHNNNLRNNPRTVGAFHQVAAIAPNVAQTPVIMNSLLPEIVDSGLNTMGLSNIVAMEKNLTVGRKAGTNPSIFGNMIRAIAPTAAEAATEGTTNYLNKRDYFSDEEDGANKGDGTSEGGPNTPNNNGGVAGTTVGNKRGVANALFKTPVDDSPIDKSMEFKYFYSLAKQEGLLPKEVSNIDIHNPNQVNRFMHWSGKNSLAVSKITNSLQSKYGNIDHYLKVGRQAYNRRYGREKKAEFIGEVLADAIFLKTAGKVNTVSKAINGLMAAAAVGAGFGIVEESADYARNKSRKKNLVSSWEEAKTILQKMPDQVKAWDGTKDNLNKARGAFNAMVSVAPDLAQNPVIAASFINTTLNNQGLIDSNSLKSLTDSQKNYTASNNYTSPFSKSPFFAGATSGFSAAGGKKLIDSFAGGIGKPDKESK